MDSIEILLSDLEEYRTPSEMKEYMNRIRGCVKASPDLSEKARIKKGKFKKLLEEFNPLLLFGNSRFCAPDSRMKIVLGNQGYDALIEEGNGDITKLEITLYCDGKADYIDGIKINERGYGEVRLTGTSSLDVHEADYIEKILANARKKSAKSYSDASLLFVVSTSELFGSLDRSDDAFIISLKNELGRIDFDAQAVYLMIVNRQDIDKIDEYIFRL